MTPTHPDQPLDVTPFPVEADGPPRPAHQTDQAHRWQRVAVALAAGHVLAITIAALPPACEPGRDGSDEAESTQAIVASAGAAGAAFRTCQAAISAVRPVLRPVQRVTGRYIRAVGLRQQWDMFSRPPRRNDYVHLRYYVQGADPFLTTRVEREPVYPASPDGLRLPVGRYFEEKAIRNARQRMLRHIREKGEIRRQADLPPDLRPLLHYYSARYRSRLAADQQLVRTEIWLGSSPIAGPAATAGIAPAARGDLRPSSGGASDPPTQTRSGPRVGTREQEGNISWTLYDVLREEGP